MFVVYLHLLYSTLLYSLISSSLAGAFCLFSPVTSLDRPALLYSRGRYAKRSYALYTYAALYSEAFSVFCILLSTAAMYSLQVT